MEGKKEEKIDNVEIGLPRFKESGDINPKCKFIIFMQVVDTTSR